MKCCKYLMWTHTHSHTHSHWYPVIWKWKGHQCKNIAQPGTLTMGKVQGDMGSGFSWMSKAVNRKPCNDWQQQSGLYHCTAPNRRAHSRLDTMARRVETIGTFGFRSISTRGSSQNSVCQSLSSGFWGSMILTWVNGKRPLRPFTSPSHWPLMFIRVTLTTSPTWGKTWMRSC